MSQMMRKRGFMTESNYGIASKREFGWQIERMLRSEETPDGGKVSE